MKKIRVRVQVVYDGAKSPAFERILEYDSAIIIPFNTIVDGLNALYPVPQKSILFEVCA